MPAKNIIVGQAINPDKHQLAKQLRKEMTPEERMIWDRVRANRLHGLSFRRQQVVDGFIVDFYCHSVGVAVEIDGPIHDQRQDFDEGRDNVLQRRGLKVIRFRNDEVRGDLDAVIARIAIACGIA